MSTLAAPMPAASAYPAKNLRWMIAISVSLAALLEVIDTSIVNVALTDMQATLGATLSEVGWVVTGYAVANVIMIPLSAWLGDAFGKKRYFVASMVGFTAASVLCGLSTSLPMLIFARILQGLMGGGLLAKAQAFLFESFPKSEQASAQALFGACVIAGPAIGPTLGGYLVTNYSWPWIFFINLPIGIIGTFMCLTFLPVDKVNNRNRSVDYLGIGLLIAWVGCFQTFLEEGNQDDWFESRYIVALATVAVVGSVLWVWRELKAKAPAVDLRVLRHKSLSAGSVVSFIVGIGLYGALFAVPIFAQQVLGYTAYQTGMLLLPGALASAFTMFLMGRISGKVDSRILIAIGTAVVVASLVFLSRISVQTSADDMFWPLVLRGAGTVMIFLPLSLATFGGVPREEVSSASGFYNLTRQLGGSVGVAILTTILAQREAFHRSILVENVSSYTPLVAQRIAQLQAAFMAKGSDAATAQKLAISTLDRSISAQSAVLSFGDMFHLVAILFVLSLGLLFFLGSGKGQKASADAH
ncbi:MDR family MFS transporter [soil metagenome]